jgi:N,N-dimethylformamidase
MMPIAAYADRLSVRPGQTIRFHVASATGARVEARVARVTCADANPAGPGILVDPVETEVERLAEPGPASVPLGSYAVVDEVDASRARAARAAASRCCSRATGAWSR